MKGLIIGIGIVISLFMIGPAVRTAGLAIRKVFIDVSGSYLQDKLEKQGKEG